MTKRILLSQLGVADPIQNNLDGAMLHIYRHYEIDEVILFNTGATKYKQKDFRKALNSVREIRLEDFEMIDYTDKIKAGEFNFASFTDCENMIMSQIIKILNNYANKDIEVYVNISSGASALVSVVYTLGQIYDFVKMVQVMLPKRKEHTREANDNKEEIQSVDDLIKTNNDNNSESENRCVEVPANSIMKPLSDYYMQGAFRNGVEKILICEGSSDVNYMRLILGESGVDLKKVLIFSSGGTSSLPINYSIFKEYFDKVYVLADGDIRKKSGKTCLDKLKGFGLKENNNLFILKEEFIECYVENKEVREYVKTYKQKLNTEGQNVKNMPSQKKVKFSMDAKLSELSKLIKELQPLVDKLR